MIANEMFEDFEPYTMEEMLDKKWKKEFKKRKSIVSNIFDQKISKTIKNYSTLKSYKLDGVTNYILTTNKMPILRGGFEKNDNGNNASFNSDFVHDDKLLNSIARSKSKILEYALCNQFEYFFTGTIDRKKYDRNDLHKYYKSLSQWVNNQNRNKAIKLKYLFIPEQHKKGEWHIHGFIKGINEKDLINFDDLHDKIYPKKLLNKNYYDFEKYRKKFGFCSLGKIKKSDACAKYMTKYIYKNMAKTNIELNANFYYHSLNLMKYEIIGKGILNHKLKLDYTFENDYIKKLNFTSNDILENIIKSIQV